MKLTILILCFGVVALGTHQTSHAQDKTVRAAVSMSAETSNREQDGLNGPVRRLRVETAKITFKDGKMIEAPRTLRETATYDPKGRKSDSVAYPVEGSTLPGKEEYKYDSNGNILEMTLRADDGSVLSKEKYDYEFDEFGNWKKMTSSVAVYENGVVSYEPLEVTYRTISYYYNDSVDKLTAAKAKPQPPSEATAKPVNSTESAASSLIKKAPSANTSDKESNSATGPTKNENPTTAAQTNTNSQTPNAAINVAASVPTPNTESVKSVAVAHVSEEVLRSSALELPQPAYPPAALLARIEGTVQVQLLIGEQGEVVNVRAISGNELLAVAAEEAARKARFSQQKLGANSARVFGVINYAFKLPVAETAATSSNTTSTGSKPKADNTVQKESKVPTQTASFSPISQPVTTTSEPANSHYTKGVAFLSVGRNLEALEELKQAIQLDPNDATAYMKLGMAYAGLGKHQETITVLKMAIRIKKEAIDSEAYYELGQAYLELEKNSDAISAFKQALYIARATAMDSSKEKSRSVSMIQSMHYSLALAYHKAHRYNDAIKELKEVLKANPKAEEAYYGLAVAYLANGDQSSAEKQLTALKSLNSKLADRIAAAILTGQSGKPGCRTIACR